MGSEMCIRDRNTHREPTLETEDLNDFNPKKGLDFTTVSTETDRDLRAKNARITFTVILGVKLTDIHAIFNLIDKIVNFSQKIHSCVQKSAQNLELIQKISLCHLPY